MPSIAHSSCGPTSHSSQAPDLLDQVADRAYTTLGACGGRLAKAAALVRAGAATLLPDGTYVQVYSQSRPRVAYTINGSCSCEDATHSALDGRCKHMLAAWLVRRMQQVTPLCRGERERQAAPGTEAPASVNCHITLEGRQVQLTLRDTDEARLLERLAQILRQYPASAEVFTAKGENVQAPVCAYHGAMKPSEKAKGMWYCPAKMADGSYCKTRHPEKAA
jgi:hypothetical protein